MELWHEKVTRSVPGPAETHSAGGYPRQQCSEKKKDIKDDLLANVCSLNSYLICIYCETAFNFFIPSW